MRCCFKALSQGDQRFADPVLIRVKQQYRRYGNGNEDPGGHTARELAPSCQRSDRSPQLPPHGRATNNAFACFVYSRANSVRRWRSVPRRGNRFQRLRDPVADLLSCFCGQGVEAEAAGLSRFICPYQLAIGFDLPAVCRKPETDCVTWFNGSDRVKTETFIRNVQDDTAAVGFEGDISECAQAYPRASAAFRVHYWQRHGTMEGGASGSEPLNTLQNLSADKRAYVVVAAAGLGSRGRLSSKIAPARRLRKLP